MSRVHAIEAELVKLSADELAEIRNWLDSFSKEQNDDASRALALREQVAAGIEQARSGKVSPFDAAAVGRIKARGRKLLSAKR